MGGQRQASGRTSEELNTRRVLWVGATPPVMGGDVTFLSNVLATGLSSKYHFDQFSTNRPFSPWSQNRKRLQSVGSRKVLLGFLASIIQGLHSIGRLVQFAVRLRRQPPDLVHFQMNYPQNKGSFYEHLLFFTLSSRQGIVSSVRYGSGSAPLNIGDFSPPLQRWLRRTYLDRISCVIVQGEVWKKHYSQFIHPSRIHVVPNVAPNVHVEPSEGASDDGFLRVLFVSGPNDRLKGAFVVARALAELSEELPIRGIALAATKDFKRYCLSKGLAEVIECHPFVTGGEKDRLLRSANVFVLASYAEGFPNSVIEAMAYALPVVVTNVGALPEIIQNEQLGYLFEPGGVDQLKTYLKELWHRPDLRREMGSRARSRVEKDFSIAELETRLGEAWRHALGHPAGAMESPQPNAVRRV